MNLVVELSFSEGDRDHALGENIKKFLISAYSIIDYFQMEAIQFRGQGQRVWPNASPWASFSETVGQPDGLDGPSLRRFCRLEF
jgi:hypothetical protein